MKTFIILALVAAVSAGPIEILSDGTHHMVLDQIPDPSIYDYVWDNQLDYAGTENFILNGTNAALGQFPFVARVTIVRSTGTGLCSGSIIQENLALTASHCVNSNPQLITTINLLVGTVDRSVAGGSTFQSAEFWWHPQPATLVDDVALIRTGTNFPNTANIRPIRIPIRAQTNFAFDGPVTLIGWGLDNTGSSAIRLQCAPFTAVPLSSCTANFRAPSEICYIDPQRWRMSQGGDSGGPVIILEGGIQTQVGIHAGRRTSAGNTFHSAARISAFLNWLAARGVRVRDV